MAQTVINVHKIWSCQRFRSNSAADAMAIAGPPDPVFVDLRRGTEEATTGTNEDAVTSFPGIEEFRAGPGNPVHKPQFNQNVTNMSCSASGARSVLTARIAMELTQLPVTNLTNDLGSGKIVGRTKA